MDRWIICLVLFSASRMTTAQVVKEELASSPASAIATTTLHVQASLDLSSKVSSNVLLPVRCGDDGRVYLRVADSVGGIQMIGVTADGKVTNFSLPVTSDIHTANWMSSFYVTGDTLTAHVRGRSEVSWKHAVTSKGVQLTLPTGPFLDYLVTFDLGGNFLKSVKVQFPLEIRQIAPFGSSGTLLVSGISTGGQKPMVVLATQDGEVLKTPDLPGDISMERFEADSPKVPEQEPKTRFSNALATSTLTPDGDRILLVREEQEGVPVFSLSASGDIREIRTESPEGYKLFSITPASEGWIGQFVRQLNNDSVRNEIYLLDRNTGKLIRGYKVDAPVGLGFACNEGDRFLFLSQADGGMHLLIASPN